MTMRLTARQMKYAKLVAEGWKELDALKEVGYSASSRYTTMRQLRDNERVNNQIQYYKEHKDEEEGKNIAGSVERQLLWTTIMNDPSFPGGVRLEASKLLGKAQGDFVAVKKVDVELNHKPVVLIPKSSPEDWEKYWEKKNE